MIPCGLYTRQDLLVYGVLSFPERWERSYKESIKPLSVLELKKFSVFQYINDAHVLTPVVALKKKRH
ncbi:MAG: hypothetical protein D3919_03300 [Candidatus Electrothrix sp. AW5]|nr:hypothetical protein [Candidatus Electrothrix gigas]